MDNKTWSCKLIQTWSSLYELKEIKKDCYKAYMFTYQIGDWIKVSVHRGEVSMDSRPLPLFQIVQTVPSVIISNK